MSFEEERATLTLVNAEKPDEVIVFTSPMKEATLKGAHAIQNLGAVETYQRRYLYMAAFEIVEADVLDASQGEQEKAVPAKQKSSQQLSEHNAKKMNDAILARKAETQMTTEQIVAKLQAKIGKTVKAVTDEDVQKVISVIAEIN